MAVMESKASEAKGRDSRSIPSAGASASEPVHQRTVASTASPTLSSCLDNLLYLGRVPSSVRDTGNRQNSQGRQLDEQCNLHGPECLRSKVTLLYQFHICLLFAVLMYQFSHVGSPQTLSFMHTYHGVAPRLGLSKPAYTIGRWAASIITTGRVPDLGLHAAGTLDPRLGKTLTQPTEDDQCLDFLARRESIMQP
jgi:hypothetical protein